MYLQCKAICTLQSKKVPRGVEAEMSAQLHNMEIYTDEGAKALNPSLLETELHTAGIGERR